MAKPLFVSFFTIADSKNLLLIDKEVIASGVYPANVPCRIVSNFNDLDIMIEVSPQVYQAQIKPRLDAKNNFAYCVTFDLGTIERPVQTPQNEKYWYITDIEIGDDLSCRLMLHRDTLFEYWTGALYSNVKDTPVIISSESIPSQLSKYSGQKVTFKEDIINGDEVSFLFPYAWNNNIIYNADWLNRKLFIIDIASNKVRDAYASQYFFDSKAGVSTYVTDYEGLIKLTNYLTTSGVFEEIATKLTTGNAGDAIVRIARSPIEFPASVLHEVAEINVGGGYTIPVAHDDIIIGSGGVNAHFYSLSRFHWTTPSDDSSARWWKSIGTPFTFEYNVNEVERMELTMPFADKIDLSQFIEFFEGQFTVGYVIDMLTGVGMCGIVKGDTIDCDEITGDWLTKFDIVIPIQTFLDIEWVEVQSNDFQRFFKGFDIVTGLAGGNFGALGAITDDPTTISPHRDTANADAQKLLIYGRFIKWGVKYVCREKGVTNQGFRHTLKPLEDIDTVQAVEFPEDYNIITVNCVKRAWTGNDAIDSDIYNVLTQRGFVKNI